MTVHEIAPIPAKDSDALQDAEAEERFDDESLGQEPSAHAIEEEDDRLESPHNQA